jgi:hypothetical protein
MNEWQPPRPEGSKPGGEPDQKTFSARVPDSCRTGVFSTGVILFTGHNELVIDFVQNIGPPAHVVARVVVPFNVIPSFIKALRDNWDLYVQRFGTPSEPPRQPADPNQRRPTLQEIYDELKLPDDLLSGAYANGLMIGHTASEFKLDFLCNFFPHSAVSSRVFLAAPQIPRMIDSLNATFVQLQQRIAAQQRRPEDEGGSPQKDPPAA